MIHHYPYKIEMPLPHMQLNRLKQELTAMQCMFDQAPRQIQVTFKRLAPALGAFDSSWICEQEQNGQAFRALEILFFDMSLEAKLLYNL